MAVWIDTLARDNWQAEASACDKYHDVDQIYERDDDIGFLNRECPAQPRGPCQCPPRSTGFAQIALRALCLELNRWIERKKRRKTGRIEGQKRHGVTSGGEI